MASICSAFLRYLVADDMAKRTGKLNFLASLMLLVVNALFGAPHNRIRRMTIKAGWRNSIAIKQI